MVHGGRAMNFYVSHIYGPHLCIWHESPLLGRRLPPRQMPQLKPTPIVPRQGTYLADWHFSHAPMSDEQRAVAGSYIDAIIERHAQHYVLTDLEQSLLADRLWVSLRQDYDLLAQQRRDDAFRRSLLRL